MYIRQRINLMEKAMLQSSCDNVEMDTILVWIHYVKTGETNKKGFGAISPEFLEKLQENKQ